MSKKLTKVFLNKLGFILFIFFVGCVTSKNKNISNRIDEKKVTIQLDSNELKGKKLMEDSLLVGKITFRNLLQDPFSEWFNKEYTAYNPNTKILDDFANNPEKLKSLSVKIYLGTWCEDSQREVPRFYKIMQFLNKDNCELIALDKNKKTKTGLEMGMNIHHVPTFILYQNGKEINRIIESPVETLEKDIISIIQKGKYVSNYSELDLDK